MSYLRACVWRLVGLFDKERKDRELSEELESHLQMHIEDNLRSGMNPEEVRRQALLALGGVEQTKERYRERRGVLWLESLLQDVRFGIRMLCKSPGFTVCAVVILAVGIGATTVVFSVFDAVLLRPLPVRQPEELVRVVQNLPRMGVQSNFPLAYYEALRDHSRTLASVFGETRWYVRFAMTDPTPTEQVLVRGVTPEFFDALDVRALYGRLLTADDAKDTPGAPPAVLSYGFWLKRFDGDSQAIGRTFALRGYRFVVVGVTPPEFKGVSVDTAPDLRIPLRAYPPVVANFNADEDLSFELAGRLKPGVTRAQAEAECLAIWNSTAPSLPQTAYTMLNTGVRLDPLERGVSVVRDRFGSVLRLLIASVSVLLLIACVNLAGLQLARGVARCQEIAVRRAVGATRARLVRQMLAENLLLVVLGAAGGLWIAVAAAPLAVGMLPPMRDMGTSLLPLVLDVGMSGRAFVFALALSGMALLLFGLTPAVPVSRASLDSILRIARFSNTSRGRQALIVIQIALCIALVTCGGLLVRTFQELRAVNPGFDGDRVATFTADASAAGYTPETEAVFLRTLTEKVRQIPGVTSTAVTARGVMRGRGVASTSAPAGQRTARVDFLNTDLHMVSPEYFDTMGIRLLAGRTFTDTDDPTAKPRKALVNEAFVRRFFPTTNSLGQYFGNGLDAVVGADFEIIGVVSNAKYRSLRQPIQPTYYTLGTSYGVFVLNVRTDLPPEAIVQPVQKALAAVDPNMAFLEIHTLAEEVDDSMAGERLAAMLGSVFGGLALLLVGVGLYGLLACSITRRRGEIGIRIALGAQRGAVLQMVVGEGLKLLLMGAAIGIAVSLALTRLLSSLLYGVTPTDPVTFVAVTLLLLGVALLACYIPARRATRIEPMKALRYE